MKPTQREAGTGAVLLRILAAVVGGYALMTLSTVAIPLLADSLGMRRSQALLWTSAIAFPAHAVIIMAVFHARTSTRAWLWLAGAAVPLGLVALLLWPTSGT